MAKLMGPGYPGLACLYNYPHPCTAPSPTPARNKWSLTASQPMRAG